MAFGTFVAVRTVTGSALEIDSSGGTTPIISIDPAYPGQTSFTELGTIVTGQWEATPVALQWGGTNNTLSAANGGILYSDATKIDILTPTATANQVLLAGSNVAPSWSTAVYPATTSANQLLYSSAANTIAGLTTANNGVLVTSSGGVPSISSTLPTATQSNITTVGTIGTGVWQGTAVAIAYGGTGATTAVNALANLGAVPLAGGTMTGYLILNANPVNSLGAATKQYVDAISSGISFKSACYAGSTANLNATYANGSAGVGATLTNNGALAAFSTDGTSPSINARILVKNQTSDFQNGIYSLTTVGSGAAAWVLTRTTDYDTNSQIVPGSATFVTNGTLYANTLWVEINTITTVGTDPIDFNQFGATNVTSVTGTSNRITSTGGTNPQIDISASYVGQTSLSTLGTITTGTWQAGIVGLAYGGTNANLTPSNGGIVYSTASALAILGDTATANQVLLSGSSTTPAWSTATYPATTTVNQILYSSATNTITGISTANNGVLITSAGGIPSISTTIPNATQLNITSLGTITTGVWNGTAITVANGGTGNTTFTAYSVICAGTTATGAFQNVSGIGTSGQVLTSNGAGTLPTWQTGISGAVTSVTGTTNRITSSGGTTPVIDIAATYVGQTSITTLGTITTGTWDGNVIALAYGGTNANLTASDGGIFYSTASAGAILAGTATANQVLLSGSATTPAWSTATYPATVTANELLYSSASNTVSGLSTANNGVLVTNGSGIPSISTTIPAATQGNITAVGTITSGTWQGTAITVPNGGTGNTTFTAYSVICAGTSATNPFQNVSGVGTSGYVLTSNGAGNLPTWQAAGTGVVISVSGTTNRITSTGGTNPVIDISAAYVGQTSITTLGTITTGTWNASLIPLAYGGTNANLTASNGGIFYSTASAGAILSGTATANQVLLSGSSTAPIWSTATYPATTTINQLLYSSAANTIVGLATGNNGVLITSAGGVPSISSTLPTATQGNITTVGTITSGTWTGTTIAIANGGTGATTAPTALSNLGAVPLAGGTMTGLLILSGDPVTNLGAVTKEYADAISQGLTFKNACYAGTTANLSATYSNGAAGVGATLTNNSTQVAFSVDGVSPASTSRILVKNQSTAAQNGIYNLTTVGSGSTNWVLTRSTDYNTIAQIQPGDFVLIDNGTVNAATAWVETATVTTIGTDSISFSQFGSSNVVSVSGTTNRITSTGGTTPVIDISASYVGQSSITTLGTITTGVWNGTVVALAYGGTNANLTASNGGIFYSTASAGAILAGTATANQILMSGSSTTPAWSTATYPATTTINRLLYSSAANTIVDLATANSGVLITSAGGVPSISTTIPNTTQLNITSLGTITTGVWNGTAITVANGGTGNTTFTAYSVICAGTTATGTFQNVSGVGTSGQVLTSNGASALPTWQAATGGVTSVTGTTNRITSSGGTTPAIDISASYVGQSSITTLGTVTTGVWNGTAITVANGGTGNTTFTAYSLICAGTTSTGVFQNVSGVGSSGQVLTSNGASALPTWQAASGGVVIVNQNSSSVTMVAGSQYFINNGASLVTLTLPGTAAQGDTFTIVGGSSGGWKMAQAASQTTNFNSTSTTTGTGGSLASTNQYNTLTVKCITANTTFVVFSSSGVITVV